MTDTDAEFESPPNIRPLDAAHPGSWINAHLYLFIQIQVILDGNLIKFTPC